MQCKYRVIILFDNSCLLPVLLPCCRVCGCLSGVCRWDKQVIMKWRPTNRLTPWNRVLEKLAGSQLVKKLPAFYGTQRLIAVFTRAHHLSLFWAKSIQFIPHILKWLWTFRKMAVLYGEALLAPCLTPKLECHPLSAVHDCLFNIFIAAFHIGVHSSICNLRTRCAVVRGSHLSWWQPTVVRIMTIYSIWM